jgi:hypothetical protein
LQIHGPFPSLASLREMCNSHTAIDARRHADAA